MFVMPDAEADFVQGGLQTETEVFGSWEGHTRGIGSKLLVNMGFVKGGALGKHREGQLPPIQVTLHTTL